MIWLFLLYLLINTSLICYLASLDETKPLEQAVQRVYKQLLNSPTLWSKNIEKPKDNNVKCNLY